MHFPPLDSHSDHYYSENYFRLIWHNRLYLYTTAALLLGILFSLNMALKKVIYLMPILITSVTYKRLLRCCLVVVKI